jgi:hypothetical protein
MPVTCHRTQGTALCVINVYVVIPLMFTLARCRFLVNYKDFVYFQADDGHHGTELWRQGGEDPPIDSVATGSADTKLSNVATLFADLNPGLRSSDVSHLAVHSDLLFFAADGIDNQWMLTSDRYDECGGFRQSTFDPRVYYVVSESNVWNKKRRYDCPVGYKWASTADAHRLFTSIYDHDHDHMWHSYGYSEVGLRHGIQEARLRLGLKATYALRVL